MSSIRVWKIGDVLIYPHLEFNKLYSFEEIKDIVKNIKDQVFADMKIYDTNDFCYETNGMWNVCFSIFRNNTYYSYMIRRDYLSLKTYACPFYYTEYSFPLDKDELKKEFNLLEEFLVSNYQGKNISTFPTS